MTISYSFNAIECTDTASLRVSDTRWLRCHVWVQGPALAVGLAFGDLRQTIEAEVVEVLETGEEKTLFRGQVRTPAAPLEVCDSPKVVALIDSDGNVPRFAVHWLEGSRSGTPVLHRAYFDANEPDHEWVQDGSIATSDAWAYDVSPVENDPALGYVVVHRATATAFNTLRFTTVGSGWAGFVFAQAHTADFEPGGVLCVTAHADDDLIVYAYEREFAGANPMEIWCRMQPASTGGLGTTWQAMSDVPPAAFVCGGLKRVRANRYMLVVEGKPYIDDGFGVFTLVANTSIGFVASQLQETATPSESGTSDLRWHLRLLSRPFARRIEDAVTTRWVYAVCGFSETTQSDYGQSSAFVVHFPEGPTGQQRALPNGNLVIKLPDARPCGSHPNAGASGGEAPRATLGRRTNHVSSVSDPVLLNPDTGFTSECKAYGVALVVYTKLIAIPNPFAGFQQPSKPTLLSPQQTAVYAATIHLEEPWVPHRDEVDHGSTLQNFHGVYAWHPYRPTPLADMLAIGGGLPQVYSGDRAVEVGWTWYPEIIEAPESVDGSGTAEPGDHFYVAVFEHTDKTGHVHRSGPSTPVVVTIPDDAQTYVVDVNVMCNTLSRRFDSDGDGVRALIKLYCARPNSTIFRLVWGGAPTTTQPYSEIAYNDPDEASMTIQDILGDISTNEPLPWQFVDGQWTPLVPTLPPAASVGWVWRDRWILVPSEEPNTFWYSLQIKPAPGSSVVAAPEFSPTNVYRFDAEALRVTAGTSMDDHSIVLAEDAVYALTGEFNNDAGFGASLSLTAVHRGVGCIDQNTLVRTDIGLFFQSARGIEFMDKGWALDNVSIGSAVEDLVASCGNLRSAEWLEQKRQVRWVGNRAADGEPIVLVYHYVEKIWTIFTLPEGDQTIISDGDSWMSTVADACVWMTAAGEQLHVVLQHGALYVERDEADAELHSDQVRLGTSGNSSDTDAYNGFDIEIGWLSLAGLLGYTRVYKVLALHDPVVATAPSLRLDIDSDVHSGEYPQTGVATQVITRSAPLVGVSDFRPAVQKLSGMHLRLRRTGSFTTLPTWSVLGFALELGVKPGLRKTSSSQRGT